MIGDLVDKHFPMRDENDNPTYRPHQKETIVKIIEAFQAEKKFVCLDGPVGCGKSVILYTASMVMAELGEPGSATYLTHQKQLQDQIIKEGWPEVKMVKGRGAYACNGATLSDNRIRCNYSGDRYKTCRNSDEKQTFSLGSDGKLVNAIEKVRGKYADDERVFRMRTGFEPGDDIGDEFALIKKYIQSRRPPDEEPVPVSVYGCIGCNVDMQECPVKSTRLLAQIHKVRILNPDVFYMLNRGAIQFFPHSKVMIFDECHKIEGIVDRIFGGGIHVDFLKEYFGIDLTELYDCESAEDFTNKYVHLMKTVVHPAKNAAIIMNRLSSLMSIKKIGGGQKFSSLMKDELVNEFVAASRSMGNNMEYELNMVEFLISVFADRCEDVPNVPQIRRVWMAVRDKYKELCADDNCVMTFPGFAGMCIHDRTPLGTEQPTYDSVKSMRRIAWFTEAIEHMDDVVSLMAVKDSFMFSAEKVDMRKEYKDGEMNRFVKENIKDWKKAYMMSIKLTPINIPGMMNMFFYKKADHVILSTGTWVGKESAMKTFGVDMNNYEFIRIPTTFDAGRRPVYVMRGNAMDFTEKIDEKPWYWYKTEEGTKLFTQQLSNTVDSVREFFKKRNGLNINVIVHSYSFDIAKRIARWAPDMDDSWIVQLAANDMPIRNECTGHTTSFIYKDELLQYIMTNPNSGLTFVSASVNEGVDFKHDIARAQIILKRPTPNIMAPYVNAQYKGNPAFNVPKDPMYLDRATYTDMIQMYGRIMRAEDDWGVTIVFDQAIAKTFNTLLSRRGAWRIRELGLDYFISAIKGGVDHNGFPYFDWPF